MSDSQPSPGDSSSSSTAGSGAPSGSGSGGSGGSGDRKPDENGASSSSSSSGTASAAAAAASNGEKDTAMDAPPEEVEEELPEEIRNASADDLLTRARMLDNDIRVSSGAGYVCYPDLKS